MRGTPVLLPGHLIYFEPVVTTSCRRPLLRRLARVFRPAFVLMRNLNPCLFTRFLFRGLYVGFMTFRPSSQKSPATIVAG